MDYSKALSDYQNGLLAQKYDVAEANKGKHAGYNPDYSFGLAALAGTNMNPDDIGHFKDAGKLPNHPTFSNEAILSGQGLLGQAEGGQWNSNEGKHSFTPSRWQMNNMYNTPEGRSFIRNYFNKREQGVELLTHPPYKKL